MYLQVDEGYFGHRKTIRLCVLLKNQEAAIYPIRLWGWAIRSAPDGDLRGMNAAEIEYAINYRAADGACFKALAQVGFIDLDEEGNPVAIHDWMEYTGAFIQKMEADAADKRLQRAHQSGKCPGLSDGGRIEDCRFCVRDRDKPAEKKKPGPSGDRRGTVGGRSTDSPGQKKQKETKTEGTPEGREAPPAPSAPLPATPEPAKQGAPLTGHVLRTRFAAIRATEVGGALPWVTPRATDGKADSFAEKLAEGDVTLADVDATLALLFRHIRDGADGWTAPSLRDPAFAFAAWMSSFTALLEEVRGVRPRAGPGRVVAGPREVHYPKL